MSTAQIPLKEQLRGFSRALFSTWLYHRRFNILFDAGEGVASSLYNSVFGIRRIFLSHGHADHIAGLVNLLNIRNLGAGNQNATLKIYFPDNNRLIDLIREYLARTQNDLSFKLEWIPLHENEEINLEDQKGRIFLRTFKTRHSNRQLSLGYNIVEIRRKLKEKYHGLSQNEINQAIWDKGKDEVAEDVEQIIFTYGGDSRPINPKKIAGSLFLCHECTYFSVEDDERNFQQHSYLDEVLQTAKEAKVENLLLFHTSLRYNRELIRTHIKSGLERINPGCRVLVLFADKIMDPLEVRDKKQLKNKQPKELEPK
ncbi:MAG: MBL fold metallo-hydrolase [Candidatus Rifleibacteriota bacterium]